MQGSCKCQTLIQLPTTDLPRAGLGLSYTHACNLERLSCPAAFHNARDISHKSRVLLVMSADSLEHAGSLHSATDISHKSRVLLVMSAGSLEHAVQLQTGRFGVPATLGTDMPGLRQDTAGEQCGHGRALQWGRPNSHVCGR